MLFNGVGQGFWLNRFTNLHFGKFVFPAFANLSKWKNDSPLSSAVKKNWLRNHFIGKTRQTPKHFFRFGFEQFTMCRFYHLAFEIFTGCFAKISTAKKIEIQSVITQINDDDFYIFSFLINYIGNWWFNNLNLNKEI